MDLCAVETQCEDYSALPEYACTKVRERWVYLHLVLQEVRFSQDKVVAASKGNEGN